MKELIEQVSKTYGITEEQAAKIIRFIQSPEAVDKNFWESMQLIVEKRLEGKPII